MDTRNLESAAKSLCLLALAFALLFASLVEASETFSSRPTVLKYFEDAAYQWFDANEVNSQADRIKESFPNVELSPREITDLAIASMIIAAHYDRISIQPPHIKHMEAPKARGRSFRADYIVRDVLWRNKLHVRDTEGCVFRRLIEGDSLEDQRNERALFNKGPNYKCNDVVTKPQEGWSIVMTTANWLTPLPDFSKPASEQEIREWRKEHTAKKILERYDFLASLATQAWTSGKPVRFSFLGQEVPFNSGKFEKEGQAQVRLANTYARLLESAKFIDTPAGVFHGIEPSEDIKNLKDSQGNNVWGGPIRITYDNPAPRTVEEFRRRTHDELSQYYVGYNRSKFISGLIYGKKGGKDGLAPGPARTRSQAEAEEIQVRDGEFAVIQFTKTGKLDLLDFMEKIKETSSDLRQKVSAGNYINLDDIKVWSESLKDKFPENMRIDIDLHPKQEYRYSRYFPVESLVDDFKIGLLFEKTEESVAWAERGGGNEVTLVVALNRGPEFKRKISWTGDQIDQSIADSIALSDALDGEIRLAFDKFFTSNVYAVMAGPEIEALGSEFTQSSFQRSGMQSIRNSVDRFLARISAQQFVDRIVRKAPNLPTRYLCTDPQMVMPTCKMTAEEWENGGVKKGWFRR